MPQDPFDVLRARIETPLVLIDVGARWGSVDMWDRFGDKAKIYCFEADVEEANRLNSENKANNVEYIPVALAANSDGLDINITEGVGCSSAFRPVKALYERYPGCGVMRPQRIIKCPSVSLDEFCASRDISSIDGLKIDTQGSELDILRGGSKIIETCKFMIVEMEFNELYEKQPLFCDVDRFLRDKGFVLWRLNNLAHYSTGVISSDIHPILISTEPGTSQYIPVDNGQLFWTDGFYVKAEAVASSDATLTLADGVAGAILASQWRLWDLTLELVRKTGDAALLQQLEETVKLGRPAQTLSQKIETLESRNRELEAQLTALQEKHSETAAAAKAGWLGRLMSR